MVQQQDNHTGTGTSTTDEPVTTSTAPSNPSVSTNSTTTTTSTLQRRISTKTSNDDKNKNNPFTAGSRNNFPSLERAWMGKKEKQSATASSSSPQDSQSSSSRNTSDHSLDLSIDARAALHEHLRHIAKFGLDGDGDGTTLPEKQADAQQQQQQGQDTSKQAASASSSSSSSPVPIMMNTLDEEWENILQGNHPLHDGSFQSSSVVLPTFNRLQVLSNEENNHNIEVAVLEMTCIEAAEAEDENGMDDYFNSSKVWQLMTPEKNRGRMQAVVTNRHEEESSDEFSHEHDDDDDEDDDGQASNTPESACLVETSHLSHDTKPNVGDNDTKSPSPCHSPRASPRASALARSLPVQPSPFASSPLRVDDVLPSVAAAAAATAQAWERRPDALDEGLATAIFQHNNSLLATSIHEDLPLITSPFHTSTTDPEGSFAEWSMASVEHSFVVPSAVTPIRPLPPLSPIHSLRGSPSSTQRGSSSSGSSGSSSSQSSSVGTGSRAQSPRLGNSSPRSWRAPSPTRMTATDWGSRDDASPIRRASSPSPQDLASSARSLFAADEDDDKDDDDDSEHPVDAVHKESSSSSSSSSPLSPSAKQAAQAAAKFWQTHHHSHSVPRSKAMTQWPRVVPTKSFESSTVGLADGPCDPVATDAAATHKDTAALISVDTTSSTDKSTMSASCLRSIRSADDALERRRYYRSVVPRRILFPNDGNDDHYHGDSFDRPRHSF